MTSLISKENSGKKVPKYLDFLFLSISLFPLWKPGHTSHVHLKLQTPEKWVSLFSVNILWAKQTALFSSLCFQVCLDGKQSWKTEIISLLNKEQACLPSWNIEQWAGMITAHFKRVPFRDFPGGAVVKNPPANARNTGSSPGPGRSHMP